MNSLHIRTRQIEASDGPALARWMVTDLSVPDQLADALPELLSRLLKNEQLYGGCIEERRADGTAWTLVGIGMSAFVSTATAETHLARPTPHFALQLLERAAREGAKSFLSPRQVARENANGGLNLVVLYYGQTWKNPADERCRRLLPHGHRIFIQVHGGFNLRLLMHESDHDDEPIFVSAGYNVLTRFAPGEDGRPARSLLGLDAVAARTAVPGTAASFLFCCPPPQLGFTPAERRLVELAMRGMTDAEIAASLSRSANTLKQTWRSIYDRLEKQAPFILGNLNAMLPTGVRGSEKRRRLLAYLLEHLEEIRPYSNQPRVLSRPAPRTPSSAPRDAPDRSSWGLAGS